MGKGSEERAQAAAALLLNQDDNVVVCRRDVRAGERLVIEGEVLIASRDVSLGHKIARRFIRCDEPIVKYGMSIGSSTAEIQPGDWVHLHNMKSDYIPSHTRNSRQRG